MSSEITVTMYTDKSIVVRGDTKNSKEELKALGGKWNANLRDGAGWIFPKTKEPAVQELVKRLNSGTSQVPAMAKPSVATLVRAKNTEQMLSQLQSFFSGMTMPERVEFTQKILGLLLTQAATTDEDVIVDDDDDAPREVPKRLLAKQ